MKKISIMLFMFCLANLKGQAQTDTLNKFNDKKIKQGYWLIYLSDSLCMVDDKKDAFYYTYIYYDNGFGFDGFFCPRACASKRNSSKFEINAQKANKGEPLLLHGNFKTYNKAGNLIGNETYVKGVPTIVEDNTYDKKGKYVSTAVYDWGDKYQNQICSFSICDYDGDKLKSKYYQAKNEKGEWKMVKAKIKKEKD